MTGSLIASASPSVNINLGGLHSPSSSVVIIAALTVLSIAPSILILFTGFTRIFIVLGLTRSGLGLQNTPPNQVLAGIALFIALFVMTPVLNQVDHDALQPYLHGRISGGPGHKDRRGPGQDLDVEADRHLRTSALCH